MEKFEMFERLPRRAKACMRLGSLIAWAMLLVPLAVVRCILLFSHVPVMRWVDLALLALLVVVAVLLVVTPMVRYRRYRYLITPEQVVVIEGLWFITKEIAPIERIHQISIKRGPVLRAYGLSKVSCITAGGIVEVDYLEETRAEEIAALLQERIRSITGRQRAEVEGHV